MSDRHRQPIMGALVGLLVGLLVGVLAACGGDDDAPSTAGPTSGASDVVSGAALTSAVPTTIPAPTTTFSPPTAPPPTPALPSFPSVPPPTVAGPESGATTTSAPPLPPPVTLTSNTHLRRPAPGALPEQVPLSNASFCAEVQSLGWSLEQCESVGLFFAVVERSLLDGRLRVQVLTPGVATPDAPATWIPVLAAEDTGGSTSPRRWDEAVVLAADTDGDGVAEVWVGYRNRNGDLDVDIVLPRRDGSFSTVADHGLKAGRVVVVPGGADTYEPVFLAGDLSCCPTGGAGRRQVRVEDGRWVATVLAPLPPGTPVPFNSFDTVAAD